MKALLSVCAGGSSERQTQTVPLSSSSFTWRLLPFTASWRTRSRCPAPKRATRECESVSVRCTGRTSGSQLRSHSNVCLFPESFTLTHLTSGFINYVQSEHKGVEPTVDQLSISVSDGLHRSAPVSFYIIIKPTNDETPSLLLANFTVRTPET